MNDRITIIGAGSFGSALAFVLMDKNKEVMFYTKNKEQAFEINEYHTNKYYFPELKLNSNVKATTVIAEALLFSDIVVIAVPSVSLREVAQVINQAIKTPKLIISVTKGLEPHTNKMVSEILEAEICSSKRKGLVILSGPSHAEEIVKRLFTTLVAASSDLRLSKEAQILFSNDYMRVYTSTDLIGVQLGGAIKNILAIACGIIAGMGLGDNTKAALITRGLAEMVRYGLSKGAVPDTFFGLTGIGDLVVTATSFYSRNYQFGYKIGCGSEPKQALMEMETVVEGVRTTEAVYFDALNNNVEMPITESVYKILFSGYSPEQILGAITKRKLKAE